MNDNPKKNENPRNLMQKIARSPLIYVAVVLVIFVARQRSGFARTHGC